MKKSNDTTARRTDPKPDPGKQFEWASEVAGMRTSAQKPLVVTQTRPLKWPYDKQEVINITESKPNSRTPAYVTYRSGKEQVSNRGAGARKMAKTEELCNCGKPVSQCKCKGHNHKVKKAYGNLNAKTNAQRWVDAAPEMERQNAKRPMVVEQMPSGAIMGRGTSAKPTSSRGAGARKMAKKLTKGRTINVSGQDPLGIRDIGSVSAYQRDAAAAESKNINRQRNQAVADTVRAVVPDVTVNGNNVGLRQGAERAMSNALYGGRQAGSVVSLTPNNKPKTTQVSFNPQNAGGKGARKASAASSLAKGQGAFINGKQVDIDSIRKG